MNIGFLINDLNAGGAERAAVSLSNYFVNNGNSVEIITFRSGESFYPLDKGVSVSCADFDEIEHTASVKRLLGSVQRMFRLRKFIKSKKLDVLVGMSFSMTWYAVFASIFTKTKAIGTERNNPYRYKATKLNTILRKLFYYLCGGYIFQTEKSAGFFTKKLRKKDIIIPNAIFNETVYELEPPQKREKVICAVGRLAEQKRFDLLIDAFNQINEKYPEYSLVIFGEGELRDSLEAQCEKLKLTEKVYMPGTNPQAVRLVNRTGVFVLSSDLEGMPNALMEAMAMGVPCVSTRCDMGPEELIRDGENGLLVDTGSSAQIADAVMRIIKNPELADKLSRNGRKMIETHSIDKICRTWLEFLQKIADCR